MPFVFNNSNKKAPTVMSTINCSTPGEQIRLTNLLLSTVQIGFSQPTVDANLNKRKVYSSSSIFDADEKGLNLENFGFFNAFPITS